MQIPDREKTAMTLVELLVVIGILAVLATLIFPSTRRSRHAAETAACLANLHQIGIALQVYAADHGGRLPTFYNRDSVTNTLPALDTALLPRQSASGVFKCPSDRIRLFENTGTSYFWNFTVNGQDVDRLFSIVGGSDPTLVPVVSDKEGFHPDLRDRVNILYADGRASKELKFSTSLP